MKTKAQQALAFARERARTAKSWLDLHNALFGIGGKLTDLFPTEKDRIAFSRSEEQAAILELLADLRKKYGEQSGTVAELAATANGTITVRLPRSIHAALLAEARSEGISLNQLCMAKLAFQLQAMASV